MLRLLKAKSNFLAIVFEENQVRRAESYKRDKLYLSFADFPETVVESVDETDPANFGWTTATAVAYTHFIALGFGTPIPGNFEEEWVLKFLELPAPEASQSIKLSDAQSAMWTISPMEAKKFVFQKADEVVPEIREGILEEVLRPPKKVAPPPPPPPPAPPKKTRPALPKPPEGPGGTIETTHFQNWKVVALLRGLGFEWTRTEDTDVFTSKSPVTVIYDGWEPSKDGSRLTDWSDLSRPESPHFGRRYLTAFRFTSPDGYDDVIVWSGSPHQSGEYIHPVGLSTWADWQQFVKVAPRRFGLGHWFEYNSISL